MHHLARTLKRLNGQRGQTLVEYSLVLAIIALGAIVALSAFALSMEDLYQTVRQAADAMTGAG